MKNEEELERYGTINRWAEELGISSSSIRRRVRAAGKPGITGRLANGRIIENGFYPESYIRELCSDLLK